MQGITSTKGEYVFHDEVNSIVLSSTATNITLFDPNDPNYFYQVTTKNVGQLAKLLFNKFCTSEHKLATFNISRQKLTFAASETATNKKFMSLIYKAEQNLHKEQDITAKEKSIILNKSLYYAAYAGNLEKVREILQLGANINTKNSDGLTPVMIAALRGHSRTANFLLKKGAKSLVEIGSHSILHINKCTTKEISISNTPSNTLKSKNTKVQKALQNMQQILGNDKVPNDLTLPKAIKSRDGTFTKLQNKSDEALVKLRDALDYQDKKADNNVPDFAKQHKNDNDLNAGRSKWQKDPIKQQEVLNELHNAKLQDTTVSNTTKQSENHGTSSGKNAQRPKWHKDKRTQRAVKREINNALNKMHENDTNAKNVSSNINDDKQKVERKASKRVVPSIDKASVVTKSKKDNSSALQNNPKKNKKVSLKVSTSLSKFNNIDNELVSGLTVQFCHLNKLASLKIIKEMFNLANRDPANGWLIPRKEHDFKKAVHVIENYFQIFISEQKKLRPNMSRRALRKEFYEMYEGTDVRALLRYATWERQIRYQAKALKLSLSTNANNENQKVLANNKHNIATISHQLSVAKFSENELSNLLGKLGDGSYLFSIGNRTLGIKKSKDTLNVFEYNNKFAIKQYKSASDFLLAISSQSFYQSARKENKTSFFLAAVKGTLSSEGFKQNFQQLHHHINSL